MLELNLCAWGKELNFGSDIKDLVAALEKDRQNSKKKNGKPGVRGAAEATGGIFGATDHARENSEDPELSDKYPGIFEVKGGFRRKGAGPTGDRKILRGMLP